MSEIEPIKSRDNRRLVIVRKIRDGKVTGQIFIEGRRLIGEALRANLEIEECFVAAGFRDKELIEAVRMRTEAISEIPDRLFDSIAGTDRSQGMILIAKRPATELQSVKSRVSTTGLPVVIFLLEINNPSNLGAIFRTAEAAGAAGIVISKNSADAFSPKALRAAMGASFRLPVWENAGLDEVLPWAADGGLTVTAADASATLNYTEIDWKTPRLLIFGSEAHGLSGVGPGKVAETMRIPMENNVESLNLAVSAGIILFEARRQTTISPV